MTSKDTDTASGSGSQKSSRRSEKPPKLGPNGLPDPKIFLKGISKLQEPREDQNGASFGRAGIAEHSSKTWPKEQTSAESEWWTKNQGGSKINWIGMWDEEEKQREKN